MRTGNNRHVFYNEQINAFTVARILRESSSHKQDCESFHAFCRRFAQTSVLIYNEKSDFVSYLAQLPMQEKL